MPADCGAAGPGVNQSHSRSRAADSGPRPRVPPCEPELAEEDRDDSGRICEFPDKFDLWAIWHSKR